MNDTPSRLPARDLASVQSAADLMQTGRADLPPYAQSLTARNRAEIGMGSPTLDGSFSIDKLAFTFHVPEVLWGKFRERMRRWGDPHGGGVHYREALEIPDPAGTGEKILIQWAPYLLRSIPFGRVELNPAKMRGWAPILETEIRPFLRRAWASTHITRIDPAVDYPVALQDHVYYLSRGRCGFSGFTRQPLFVFRWRRERRPLVLLAFLFPRASEDGCCPRNVLVGRRVPCDERRKKKGWGVLTREVNSWHGSGEGGITLAGIGEPT